MMGFHGKLPYIHLVLNCLTVEIRGPACSTRRDVILATGWEAYRRQNSNIGTYGYSRN